MNPADITPQSLTTARRAWGLPSDVVNGIKIQPLPEGGYALVAVLDTGEIDPLTSGTLRTVILDAERIAAACCLPVEAHCLAGPTIWVKELRQWLVGGRWITYGTTPNIRLGNAHKAYELLRSGEMTPDNNGTAYRYLSRRRRYVWQRQAAPEGDHILTLAAWDIVLQRARDHGRISEEGVPLGSCPRCLHRHVIVEAGTLTCQECNYEASHD